MNFCLQINRSAKGLIYLTVALAALCVANAHALVAELSTEENFYTSLSQVTASYLDISDQENIGSIVDKREQFQAIQTPYINFGAIETGRLWLSLRVQNKTSESGLWRLDINRQYYQELDVYLVRTKSTEHLLAHTKIQNFSERPIQDRLLATDFRLDGNELASIYISIKTNTSSFMPLGVGTVSGVQAQRNKDHTQNWLLNGALLSCIAFSLMMISILGWRISLSFSLYILAGMLYVMHADGYLFSWLWPNNMAWNDPMNLSLMVAMPVFGMAFARQLFDFKKLAPRFDKIILVYMCAATLVVLFSFAIFEVRALKIIAYLFTPLGSLFQLAAAIIALRLNLLGARPYFVGALVILASLSYATLSYVFVGQLNIDTTLNVGHVALLTESLAFAAAITVRLIGLRNERDRALEGELTVAREKLQLAARLQDVQNEYRHARKLADLRRNQLSEVSHDLQQPLISLRHALNNVNGVNESTVQQMHSAFDYLEKLACEQLKPESKNGSKNQDISDHHNELETFNVSTILDNVAEMFRDEAIAKKLEFRYRPSALVVTADPIGLMRAISNLVANAIKHVDSGGILISARKRANRVRIEVWDTGIGMTDAQLEHFSKRHTKGKASQGTGLGLAIVRSYCEQNNYVFTLRSRPERGSLAAISIPLTD